MADEQLSAQDIEDLKQIHQALPDGDPRKQKVASLLSASAPAIPSPAPSLIAQDAMKQSGVTGTKLGVPSPKIDMQAPASPAGAVLNTANANSDAAGKVYRAAGQDVAAAVKGIPFLVKKVLEEGGGTPEGSASALGRAVATPIIESAQDPNQSAAETAGLVAGVNSPAIKEAALKQDYPSIVGHSIFSLGAALVGGELSKAATKNTKLFTPPDNPNVVALRSMMGAESKKDLFPAAEAAVPDIQKAARQMGVKPDTFTNRLVNGKSPQQLRGRGGADVTEGVINKAVDNVEGEAQSAIKPVAGQPFDGAAASTNLRKTITPELQEFAPSYAAEIDKLATKLSTARTIGEADQARKVMNDIASKFYAKSDMAQSTDLQNAAAMAEAADNLRGTLYDQVQNLSGQDLKAIRQREASLMEVKGRVVSQLNKARGAYAADAEPTAVEGLRNAGNSNVKSVSSGLYKATIGKAVGQNPIERVNSQFGKVIAGAKPRAAAATVPPSPPQIKGLLPSSTPTQMGAPVPGMMPGENLAAFNQQMRQPAPGARRMLPEPRGPAGIPVRALAADSGMTPGERVAALEADFRRNSRRKLLPARTPPIPLGPPKGLAFLKKGKQ